MKKDPYLINDRLDIPNDINSMSKEELDKEIARLEAENAAKKLSREKKAV